VKYSQQLLTIEWKNKRFEILKRDCFKCQNCNSKSNLQVHHKRYIKGRNAWDYPNSFLITVCDKCHELIHKKSKIEIIKDRRKKPTVKKISKKQLKYQMLYPNFYKYLTERKM